MGAGLSEEVQEADGTEGLLKLCNRCKQAKDISEFTPRQYRHDGYEPSCRTCVNLWARLKRTEKEAKGSKYNLRLSVEQVKQKLRQLGAYQREIAKANLSVLNAEYAKNKALRARLTKGGA